MLRAVTKSDQVRNKINNPYICHRRGTFKKGVISPSWSLSILPSSDFLSVARISIYQSGTNKRKTQKMYRSNTGTEVCPLKFPRHAFGKQHWVLFYIASRKYTELLTSRDGMTQNETHFRNSLAKFMDDRFIVCYWGNGCQGARFPCAALD